MLLTGKYLEIDDGHSSVLHGTWRLFLAMFAMGCVGTVSGVSCVFPEPFVALYKAFKEVDLVQARKLQGVVAKYCEVLHNGVNISYFKEGLKLRGLDGGHMRFPQFDIKISEFYSLEKQLLEIESLSGIKVEL